ncbi:MAG TPA: alpha/beta fold hydrolase [bacterium]
MKYRQYGSGPAQLIILHGLLGSSQNWHSVAQRLAEDLPTLVPDLRNHGDSPHGEHSLDLISHDIYELLESEQLDSAFLLGHSMGGLSTMLFAFSHPERVRGLVVVDIAPDVAIPEMRTIFQALLNLDLARLRSREEADRLLQASIKSSTVRQFLLQNLKRHDDGRFTWRCNLRELSRFTEGRQQFKIAVQQTYGGPSLFIAGGRSDYRIWEKEQIIEQHFSLSKLVVFPNAGHWVHFDAMADFVKTVREFLMTRDLLSLRIQPL